MCLIICFYYQRLILWELHCCSSFKVQTGIRLSGLFPDFVPRASFPINKRQGILTQVKEYFSLRFREELL